MPAASSSIRRKALAFLIIGRIVALAPGAFAADSVLSFHADPATGDLDCPPLAARPLPAAEPAENTQIPGRGQLGPLARPVVRAQPVFDPSAIAGFALSDASGPRPRRIAVWGDSHVAAGAFMRTVVERLQSRGVTVGTRYLPPSMGRANVRLPALHGYCIGAAWTTELAYSAQGRLQVGPGLLNRVAEAGAESYLWLDFRSADRQPRLRQLQVVYRAPQGAVLDVSLDGAPEQRAVLSPDAQSQTLTLRADAPFGVLKLHVRQGRIALNGFILDYANPPLVTFDVFGVPSATAQGWANLDPAYLTQALHGQDYDAVVLEYGTNEGSDPHFDRGKYEAGLTAALQNMRKVFPSASCALIGPPDRGVLVRRRGKRVDLLRYARNMRRIEEAQAQIGGRFACAHWNWQALMGGEGGSYGWARNTPPLMGPDLTHMTASGYKLTGEALAHSLGY